MENCPRDRFAADCVAHHPVSRSRIIQGRARRRKIYPRFSGALPNPLFDIAATDISAPAHPALVSADISARVFMTAMRMRPMVSSGWLAPEQGPLLTPRERQLCRHQPAAGQRFRLASFEHHRNDVGCKIAELDQPRELGAAAAFR